MNIDNKPFTHSVSTEALIHSLTNYIGIDIGTTSTKAVVFTENGKVIEQHSIGYPMFHPKPNFAEQNPDEILDAFLNILSKLTQQNSLISFSSAMHSLMAVDEKGNPLTNLILWADNRATEIAKTLKASNLGREIYHKTGIPIHPYNPFTKLLWLKENEPQIFEKAHKFIGIKEYIWHKLFDEFKIDISLASGTGILNMKTHQWDDLALETIGISKEKLSEIVPITYSVESCEKGEIGKKGESVKEKNSELRTLNSQLFFIGAGDGPLANLGTGAMQKGKMAFTLGTSGAVRIASKKPYTDKKMRTFSFVLDKNTHIIGGSTNNGAVVLQWLKEAILQTNENTENLIQQAENIPAGAEGLLFLPYILGERAPIWNAEAKGVFFGLSKNHTKAHLIRAVLEGIILNLYSIGKILMQKQEINEILVSGGFAQSKVWLQILADIFQKKIVISETIEGSAWGAVLVAKGLEFRERKFEKGDFSEVLPNEKYAEFYQNLHQKFERIYEKLKDEF